MQTQTQNSNAQILKGILSFVIYIFIFTGSSFAYNANDGKNSKNESLESIESLEEINELLESLNVDEFEFSNDDQKNAFQVIGKNDEVLFSGAEKEWENQSNKQLVIMKRKAEFLFESNGNKIYKVF